MFQKGLIVMNSNDIETRKFIKTTYEEYKSRRLTGKIDSNEIFLAKNLIALYFYQVAKPHFSLIIKEYKRLFIENESLIDEGVTQYEKEGISLIYDYINDFDFQKDNFNIFISSLIIHSKLYSKCPNPEYGGKLRENEVVLKDFNTEVPSPKTASRIFNMFLNPTISNRIFDNYYSGNLFGYINDCIILSVKLIKLQPFEDGNKRTIRALLNLLLKRINIPPLYIDVSERKEYKDALLKAIRDEDYDDIVKFYYYKICDAIVLLDINNSELVNDTEQTKNYLKENKPK